MHVAAYGADASVAGAGGAVEAVGLVRFDDGENGRGEKKRDLIAGFFSSRALLFAALAMLLSVIVMLVFAVFFGGHVFDKTAFIFGVLFVVQFAYWLKINRKRRHLVLTVIYGAVALAFVALYALEAVGVLP